MEHGQERGVTFLDGWTAVPVTGMKALEENQACFCFVFWRERFGRTQKFNFGDNKVWRCVRDRQEGYLGRI